MRIIAGELARRRFAAPKGRDTRPTSDRVREALFAHLEAARLPHGFRGTTVFDLYAGSGGLAFEALSRGAAHAVLVDSGREAARCIRENVDSLGLRERTTVLASALPRALARARRRADLIFADPPYADSPLAELAEALERADLVEPECIFVYEHAARDEAPTLPGWSGPDARRWGDTAISIYERAA